MGSRSVSAVGELLLRPSTFTRLSLFTTASSARVITPAWNRRTLTTSTPSQTAQPQRRDESAEDSTPQASAPGAANPYLDFVRRPNAPQWSHPSPASTDEISQSIDDIFASTNNPNFRRRSSMRPLRSTNKASAADQTKQAFGDNFSKSVGSMRGRKPLDLEVEKMQMPEDLASGMFDPKPMPPPEIPESEKIYPRLTPSYGRKVELDASRGRDLVRGIKILTAMCYRNRVKADFNKQRFHERPGLKRKRLKSERWRARFKVGFEQVTGRVRELTRKGW